LISTSRVNSEYSVWQIDVVDAEPAQRSLHRRAEVLRPPVRAAEQLAVRVERRAADLRGDHGLVPPSGQRPTEQPFGRREAVEIGGVEHGHAQVERALDGGLRRPGGGSGVPVIPGLPGR
jgi:hypothetical protein